MGTGRSKKEMQDSRDKCNQTRAGSLRDPAGLQEEDRDILGFYLLPAGGALLVGLDPALDALFTKDVPAGNGSRRGHPFKADHAVQLVVFLRGSSTPMIKLLPLWCRGFCSRKKNKKPTKCYWIGHQK